MKKFLPKFLIALSLCACSISAAQQAADTMPAARAALEEKIAEREARIKQILSAEGEISQQDIKTIAKLREENRIAKRELRQMKKASANKAENAAAQEATPAQNKAKKAQISEGEQSNPKKAEDESPVPEGEGKDSIWNHIFPF